MPLFQAKATGAYRTAVAHIIEADSIVTGEMDSHNFPVFLSARSFCGREVRATGLPASRTSKDLCAVCRGRADFAADARRATPGRQR